MSDASNYDYVWYNNDVGAWQHDVVTIGPTGHVTISPSLVDRGWGMPVKSIVLEKPVEIHQLEPHPWTQVDLARYPHECPRCGAPAYVGLTSVECSDGCG